MLNRRIKVVGQDPSLRNWGLAEAFYDLDSKLIVVDKVSVIQPVLPTNRQARVNSKDLESGYQLYRGAVAASQTAQAVFVEVPVGSQSSRAMASYGICVGVLGALRANGIPFFEITPTETKLAGSGSKTASKKDMINWAVSKHPEANWPSYKRNGEVLISESDAEHMADAIAVIYAGIASLSFQQMLPFLMAQNQTK